jgi:hypothetical protein
MLVAPFSVWGARVGIPAELPSLLEFQRESTNRQLQNSSRGQIRKSFPFLRIELKEECRRNLSKIGETVSSTTHGLFLCRCECLKFDVTFISAGLKFVGVDGWRRLSASEFTRAAAFGAALTRVPRDQAKCAFFPLPNDSLTAIHLP